MTNTSKRKGGTFERQVRDYLRKQGWTRAERRALSGADDCGDIVNGPTDFTIECKAQKAFDLAGWLAEAEREAENVRRIFGQETYSAVFVKAPGKRVEDGYAIVRIREFVLMAALLEGD